MMVSMRQTVRVSLPVSPEAASVLNDEDRLREIGRLVSVLVIREKFDEEELLPGDFAHVLAQTRADAAESGLTDAEVDAEIAKWKHQRPGPESCRR